MKPNPVPSIEIAKEFGIEPGTPNWRKRVRALREDSLLERDYQTALAAWYQTEEGQREMAAEESILHAETARREKYKAAGMEHLLGATIQKSKRGSVGILQRIGGGKMAVVALTAKECEFLGYTPGPANS